MCAICHALPVAPVALQHCGHIFCSYCVRRYLGTRSRCPEPHCAASATTTSLTPLRALDCSALFDTNRKRVAAGEAPPSSRPSYLVHLTSANASKQLIKSSLAKAGLSHVGTYDELAARYREFVLQYNANIDAAIMEDDNVIVERVRRWEGVMSTEKQKAAKREKDAKSVVSLFWKSTPQSTTRKRPRGDDVYDGRDREVSVSHMHDIENVRGPSGESVVLEGDGFTDLIRKTKMRTVAVWNTARDVQTRPIDYMCRCDELPETASADCDARESLQENACEEGGQARKNESANLATSPHEGSPEDHIQPSATASCKPDEAHLDAKSDNLEGRSDAAVCDHSVNSAVARRNESDTGVVDVNFVNDGRLAMHQDCATTASEEMQEHLNVDQRNTSSKDARSVSRSHPLDGSLRLATPRQDENYSLECEMFSAECDMNMRESLSNGDGQHAGTDRECARSGCIQCHTATGVLGVVDAVEPTGLPTHAGPSRIVTHSDKNSDSKAGSHRLSVGEQSRRTTPINVSPSKGLSKEVQDRIERNKQLAIARKALRHQEKQQLHCASHSSTSLTGEQK